jgi:pimeloyl-ACP methyl ester carboxylesterase
MQTVKSADGTTIAYDRLGEGPPVICLHGTGVRRTMWRLLASQADNLTIVAPDRRGRGDSGDTEPYAFEREIEDVAALAAARDRDPVLFGSSFGGLLALDAATSLDAAGVVLYEPPMPMETIDADEREGRASLAEQTAAHIEAGDPEAAARTFFTEATGAESVEHWPIWPECVEFAHTIPRECRTVEAFTLDDVTVDVPTLLFTGDRSPGYLRAGVDELAARIPDSTVETLAGVGHAGVATAPDRVAARLDAFVA